jgi:hypothetical protein
MASPALAVAKMARALIVFMALLSAGHGQGFRVAIRGQRNNRCARESPRPLQ